MQTNTQLILSLNDKITNYRLPYVLVTHLTSFLYYTCNKCKRYAMRLYSCKCGIPRCRLCTYFIKSNINMNCDSIEHIVYPGIKCDFFVFNSIIKHCKFHNKYNFYSMKKLKE